MKDYLEDSTEWDVTIRILQKMRNKSNHSDDHYPEKKNLQAVRQRAIEFRKWIILAGAEYTRRSKGFPFIGKYIEYSRTYCRRASKIPSLVKEQGSFMQRLNEINDLHDITGEDLVRLISFVREVERYDQREFTCPKCGGRLGEILEPLGLVGVPDEFILVIACDSCNYIKSEEKN